MSYSVGSSVIFNGCVCQIIEIIKGEIDYKKPNKQNGVLLTGYHRKPQKYKLSNGAVVFGKTLKRHQKTENNNNYNFERPMWAQDLGDEWDDYAWGADDF